MGLAGLLRMKVIFQSSDKHYTSVRKVLTIIPEPHFDQRALLGWESASFGVLSSANGK